MCVAMVDLTNFRRITEEKLMDVDGGGRVFMSSDLAPTCLNKTTSFIV